MPIVSKLQLPFRLLAHSCVRTSVWLSIKQIRILWMHHPSRGVILETVYLPFCRSWWSFCLSIRNWENTSITGCLWVTITVTKPRYATKAKKKIKKLWSQSRQWQLYKSCVTLSNNQTWSYYESLLSHYRFLRSKQFVGSCHWGISSFLSFRRWIL